MSEQVWMDGQWGEAGAAGWPVNARNALLGDGVFETIRVRDGIPLRLPRHLARLRAGCAALGLDFRMDDATLQALCMEAALRNGLDDAALRLTVAARGGPRGLVRSDGAVSILLSAAGRKVPDAPLRLSTSIIRRSASSFAARHKTLSYADNVAARREAAEAGADMALLLDTDGHVSGGDCANLFWVSGGALFTPSLDCAVLPGTVRAELVEGNAVETGTYGRDALDVADAAFVTNALMGVVPVADIDGRALDPAHPLIVAVAAGLD